MLKQTFQRRFAEVENIFSEINFVAHKSGYGIIVENGEWRKWATSAQSLIAASCEMHSPHLRNFDNLYDKCGGNDYDVKALHAVFQSAKEDVEGGYVFDVDLRISGEVFGDFVALAKQALSEGNKDVAAVLACAALEDALKRYAAAEGIDTNGKTMTEVINALKGAGLVAGAQKSLLDAMPRVRNAALHADWAKISEPDVNSVIGFVEQFLLTKFSGN